MLKIFLFTYAGLFLMVTLPWYFLTVVIGWFSVPLRNRLAFGTARFIARSVLSMIGVDVVVEGTENIPPAGSVLFVGNHRSLIDVLLVVAYTPRVFAFIAKDSLKKIPLLSWWMAAFQCLFLDRKSPRNALKTILDGIENMKQGHSYVIFPEGTRNHDNNDLLPFKKGSLKLAEKSDSPIVPFALRGTDEIYEQNNYQVKSGQLFLTFGAPIYLSDMSAEEKKDSHAYVRSVVADLFQSTFPTIVEADGKTLAEMELQAAGSKQTASMDQKGS